MRYLITRDYCKKDTLFLFYCKKTPLHTIQE